MVQSIVPLTAATRRGRGGTREQLWEKRLQIPTVVAALLVIPTVVIEESGLPPGWQVLAAVMNWTIWSVFLAQVSIMLCVTGHRRQWLRNHLLEVLIVLLTPPFLPVSLQYARVLRLVRLLRFVATARSLRSFFSVDGLKFATVIAIFGVLGAGALFATVESQQHLSTWDGIWWAINQVTTAGSEIAPHTAAGRVVAIAVLLVGVGYIAVLTGAVAQFFIKGLHADADASEDVGQQIHGLRVEMRALREEIQRLPH